MKWNAKTIAVLGVIALMFVGAIIYLLHPEWFMTQESERAWRTGEELKVADIIRAGNANACNGITYKAADGIDYKTVCKNNIVAAQAEATLDVSLCGNLDNILFSVKSCEETVISKKLSQGGGLVFCESLSAAENKKYCENVYWSTEALKKKDASVCKNISDDTKQLCEDSVLMRRLANGERLDCKLFSEALRFTCESFYSAVNKTDDTARRLTCNGLSDVWFRRACLEFKR